MKSILSLFEETKKDCVPDHSDRMLRGYKYLPAQFKEFLPVMRHPNENSKEFKKDIEIVLDCHKNPSMTTSFLRDADESVEDIFKTFCEESGYKNIDWKKISDVLKEVDSIVLNLKYENNRPRPIHYLKGIDDTIKAKYKKSPSFPSGHTTMAYFICDVVSNAIPDLRQDLQTLASLIGQSRIENAVHFPTDIEYGRLVGETLADIFSSGKENSINKHLTRKCYKSLAEKIISKSSSVKDAIYDLAYFLNRSAEIESASINIDDCFEASKYLMMGIPPKNITSCPHINSHIDSLAMANNLGKIDSNYKVHNIHKCFDEKVLDRGLPGEFRNFSHSSPSGCKYPEPYDLNQKLKKCHTFKDQPWLRHVVYEYIHPFCDGNGRSGRVILVSDLDFDIAKANSLIGDNYINNIIAHIQPDKIEKFL